MAINNLTLNSNIQSVNTSTVKTADSESKNLANQIMNKQQRLKQLDSDVEKSAKIQEETKAKLLPPVENIQKMLASDSVIQQERVLESVAGRKEGRENVLATEIQSDKLYGTDTTAKQEELSASRRKGAFEIEEVEKPKNQTNYIMDSGAKIIIR